MRRLGCLVVLLALGAGAFFADQALTATVERAATNRVSNALKADADVEFEGWPVSLRILQGSIPTTTVSAIDVPLGRGARLDVLDIVLTDVKVNINGVRAVGGGKLPQARRGTFEAELGESTLEELTEFPGGVSVTLQGGKATLATAGVKAGAKVRARNGDIVVIPSGRIGRAIGAEIPVDLSDAPGAPAVRTVEIEDGALLLTGDLEEVRR